MEDWQKRHITLAQPKIANVIATKNWLISEIENNSKLINEELENLVGNYFTTYVVLLLCSLCAKRTIIFILQIAIGKSTDKTNYLIEVLKRRPQGYKILLFTLLQNLFTEGLIILQDTFAPILLQDMKIEIVGNEHYLTNIFTSENVEKLCSYMKQMRVTDFTRFIMKLTPECTLLLCVEYSGDDTQEEIQIKIEMISALLKMNPKLIHKKDSYGRTPLLAKRCHLDLIKYFVQNGADLCATDDDGYTIVHVAAGWMSPDKFHELVKFLLQNSKTCELFKLKECMGNSSLHFALSYLPELRVDTLRLILEETEINVNDTNRYDENLLYRAFLGGQNAEVLKLLMEYGANYVTKKQNRQNDFGGWGNAEAFMYFLGLGIDVFQ